MTSQKDRIAIILSDFQRHGTPEIVRRAYGSNHLGICRISARIYDLKQDGFEFEDGKFDDKVKSKFYYQLKNNRQNRYLLKFIHII